MLYAIHNEMAVTPSDVLMRRMSIILEDWDRGVGIVEEVADTMAQELGWSPERRQQLVDEYKNEVRRQQLAEQEMTATV